MSALFNLVGGDAVYRLLGLYEVDYLITRL